MSGADPRSRPDPPPSVDAGARVQALVDVGRTAEALRAAQAAAAQTPDDPTALALVAYASLANGNPVGARHWAERSLARDPNRPAVHHIRALAILDGAGQPEAGRAAITEAVRLDPEDGAYLYTLVRACVICADIPAAKLAADRLRRTDPTSHRVPLADALVELAQAPSFELKRSTWLIGIVIVATRGLGLIVWGIWWLVVAIRRAPHLRRADAHLQEALARDPEQPAVRRLAAEVMALRFRYTQSVRHDLMTAALDARLVNAGRLAGAIARRATVATAIGWAAWLGVMLTLDAFVSATGVAAGIGGGVAAILVAALVWFDRRQTTELPTRLRQNVQRRGGPVIAAGAATALLASWGLVGPGDGSTTESALHLGALIAAPMALALTAYRLVQFVPARRHLGRPPRAGRWADAEPTATQRDSGTSAAPPPDRKLTYLWIGLAVFLVVAVIAGVLGGGGDGDGVDPETRERIESFELPRLLPAPLGTLRSAVDEWDLATMLGDDAFIDDRCRELGRALEEATGAELPPFEGAARQSYTLAMDQVRRLADRCSPAEADEAALLARAAMQQFDQLYRDINPGLTIPSVDTPG